MRRISRIAYTYVRIPVPVYRYIPYTRAREQNLTGVNFCIKYLVCVVKNLDTDAAFPVLTRLSSPLKGVLASNLTYVIVRYSYPYLQSEDCEFLIIPMLLSRCGLTATINEWK